MAKKPAKTEVKKAAKPAKKSVASSKSKASDGKLIEKINEESLKKLIALNIEPGLQAEIQWCLGSYRNDKNPSGLYLMAEKALQVFTLIADKDPKAIPSKFLGDIKKALKNR